ncbi:MAG: hypothetical protein WDN23_01070 [Edaphobacter sp.]
MTWLACVLLVIGVFVYVFYPDDTIAPQAAKPWLEFLRERRDVLYDNLRDLNFEYRAGKYTEEDYVAQRASLENEAAGVVAEIGGLEGTKSL